MNIIEKLGIKTDRYTQGEIYCEMLEALITLSELFDVDRSYYTQAEIGRILSDFDSMGKILDDFNFKKATGKTWSQIKDLM